MLILNGQFAGYCFIFQRNLESYCFIYQRNLESLFSQRKIIFQNIVVSIHSYDNHMGVFSNWNWNRNNFCCTWLIVSKKAYTKRVEPSVKLGMQPHFVKYVCLSLCITSLSLELTDIPIYSFQEKNILSLWIFFITMYLLLSFCMFVPYLFIWACSFVIDLRVNHQ